MELCALCVLSRLFFSIFYPPFVTLPYTKRLRLILILLAVIAIGWLVAALTSDPVPNYQGSSIVEWACDFVHRQDDQSDHGEQSLAAIRSMGTNGLNYLVKMLATPRDDLRNRLINLANSQKIIHVHIRTAEDKFWAAFTVLRRLGTNSLPAVPRLVELTRDRNVQIRKDGLTFLLYFYIPRADFLAAVTERLHDPDAEIRAFAAAMIRTRDPDEAKKLGLKVTKLRSTGTTPPITNVPNQ